MGRNGRAGSTEPLEALEFEKRTEKPGNAIPTIKASKKHLRVTLNLLEDEELRVYLQTIMRSAFMQLQEKFIVEVVRSPEFQALLQKRCEAVLEQSVKQAVYAASVKQAIESQLATEAKRVAKERADSLLSDENLTTLIKEEVRRYLSRVLPNIGVVK